MTALLGKARTAETYLAGLGASGALIGGAIVAFVMLVGVVSFNAWPEASGLFTFSGGQAEVGTVGPTEAGQQTAKAAVTTSVAGGDRIRAARREGDPRVIGGTRGGTRPGAGAEPGIAGGIGGPGASETQVPRTRDPGTSQTGAGDFVSRTVSNLGNTVERNTQTLGETLDQATGTRLGGSVGDLGETVNDALQTLSGSQK